VFDDPKTMAGLRTVPLPEAALQLLAAWKARAKKTSLHELVFSTVSGKPIGPSNVLRRWIWPACAAADLPRAHVPTNVFLVCTRQGHPGQGLARIMGHTKVDTTVNVYTQVLDGAVRAAADRVGSELFRIV
jgi:integrase